MGVEGQWEGRVPLDFHT